MQSYQVNIDTKSLGRIHTNLYTYCPINTVNRFCIERILLEDYPNSQWITICINYVIYFRVRWLWTVFWYMRKVTDWLTETETFKNTQSNCMFFPRRQSWTLRWKIRHCLKNINTILSDKVSPVLSLKLLVNGIMFFFWLRKFCNLFTAS